MSGSTSEQPILVEDSPIQKRALLIVVLGVSWITGHESAKGDAEVLDQWPEGGRSEKVPTRIAYASENTCIKDGIDKFGFEVTSDMKGYWWFKLGLDKVAEPTAFDDPLMEEAVGRGLMQCAAHKSHQEMAADFLRYMYQNTLIVLSRRVGPAALTLTAMVFHITLPAAWSHKARDATRMAAIDAGFGSRPHDKIMLTDEPEAAMICAIKTNAAAFQERSVIKVRGSEVTLHSSTDIQTERSVCCSC